MKQLKELGNLEATKKAFSLWDEFKNFAFKGNVVDLAVGVIIGAAFGAIVKSLVDDLLMPVIGLLLPGDKGYESWAWTVQRGVDAAGNPVLATIPYGKFLGAVVNFAIIALVLYIFIVKFLGWILKAKKAEGPPPPTKEQELLTEIRDLLKQQQPAK